MLGRLRGGEGGWGFNPMIGNSQMLAAHWDSGVPTSYDDLHTEYRTESGRRRECGMRPSAVVGKTF